MNRLAEAIKEAVRVDEAAHSDIAKVVSFASSADQELQGLFRDVRDGLTAIDMIEDEKDLAKAKEQTVSALKDTIAAVKVLSTKLATIGGVLNRMVDTVKLTK